ncbi:hypothetical protein VTH06DRAFT_2481 [Thermothelomyces fergusii]
MDQPHQQEFHVRDLLTRSVTLFPTQAQVIREIKNVTLKPGPNEIVVVGVTPTADENSIKVEGTGLATITDITVELLPNRDIFEEIYPDSDSEQDTDESDEEEDGSEDKTNAALEEVKDKLVALQDEQRRANEIVASAESRLQILDSYCHSLKDRNTEVDISASLETYRKERQVVFLEQMQAAALERDLTKRISKLVREMERLERLQAREEKKAAKEKAKAKRAEEKRRAQQRRRDEERRKERDRIRKERERFWPRVCYTVRISLDAGATFTPGSSRRSSIASPAEVPDTSPKENQASVTCDLTLSYLTSSAFWSPSYDLALSTTTNTATLSFDALLINNTSETWTNSKVVLSTSQANFSGLQDDVPSLVPWRLRLAHRGGAGDGSDIVHSREEVLQKEIWKSRQNAAAFQKPRTDLFGVDPLPKPKERRPAPPPPPPPPVDSYLQARTAGFGKAAVRSGPFYARKTASALEQARIRLESCSAQPAAPESASYAPRLFAASGSPDRAAEMADIQPECLYESVDNDEAATMLESAPQLAFEDPSFEESGLTATYDLPQAKTLKPSGTPSKQRIARISFSDVGFSRTVVAKYRPAAYLRARLRNASKLPLLPGPAGLTLDGTFLGRSTLPRCSAGDSFDVALGVDPAIQVTYLKPEVTHSTRGVFSKGESNVYTRAVTLVNTRAAAGRPVDITVLDQVPVSEDEKIRVEILQPAGLSASGGIIRTGAPAKEGAEGLDWGSAVASLKKAGEVQWTVSLKAGKGVKLALQYEVSFPTGERVAEVM